MADKTQAELYAEVCANYERRLHQQVNSISRLLTAVRPGVVPESGTVVLFKLADNAFWRMLPGDPMPYLEVESSYVDSADRVIITLKAVDVS